MSKISFFQFYHNGDGFVSKEYIRQIINALPDFEFEYLHNNHPKSLMDLGIRYGGSPNFIAKSGKHSPRFIKNKDHLYVHTWIGAYGPRHGNPAFFFKDGIRHNTLIKIWNDIYSNINEQFGTTLKIKEKEDYIGEIDFSYFDVSPIIAFLKNRPNKKILFSNGSPMSKQSFNGDMSDIIHELAEKYPTWDFYCTNKFSTEFNNIFFTDNIIPPADNTHPAPEWGRSTCDLNEISFLSENCNIIVGKNSGPFIYCITKNNLFNPDKTIISFNKLESDSIIKDLKISAKYIWSDNFNVENIKNIIECEITKYLHE